MDIAHATGHSTSCTPSSRLRSALAPDLRVPLRRVRDPTRRPPRPAPRPTEAAPPPSPRSWSRSGTEATRARPGLSQADPLAASSEDPEGHLHRVIVEIRDAMIDPRITFDTSRRPRPARTRREPPRRKRQRPSRRPRPFPTSRSGSRDRPHRPRRWDRGRQRQPGSAGPSRGGSPHPSAHAIFDLTVRGVEHDDDGDLIVLDRTDQTTAPASTTSGSSTAAGHSSPQRPSIADPPASLAGSRAPPRVHSEDRRLRLLERHLLRHPSRRRTPRTRHHHHDPRRTMPGLAHRRRPRDLGHPHPRPRQHPRRHPPRRPRRNRARLHLPRRQLPQHRRRATSRHRPIDPRLHRDERR
jgi:hypothetical protein